MITDSRQQIRETRFVEDYPLWQPRPWLHRLAPFLAFAMTGVGFLALVVWAVVEAVG
jgi:hypothetical protein